MDAASDPRLGGERRNADRHFRSRRPRVGEGRMITSVLFARIGLAASVGALMAFGAPALAAPPTAACPGEVSVGATGDMVPAPSGMPLNCTAAFYDGTVNFAGRVTGYSYDGYTSITTIYDQEGQVEGVTNSLGETIILSPERGELSTITDPLGRTTTFTYKHRRIGD